MASLTCHNVFKKIISIYDIKLVAIGFVVHNYYFVFSLFKINNLMNLIIKIKFNFGNIPTSNKVPKSQINV